KTAPTPIQPRRAAQRRAGDAVTGFAYHVSPIGSGAAENRSDRGSLHYGRGRLLETGPLAAAVGVLVARDRPRGSSKRTPSRPQGLLSRPRLPTIVAPMDPWSVVRDVAQSLATRSKAGDVP